MLLEIYLVQPLFAAICIQGSCAGNKIHVSRIASTGCCDNEERSKTAEPDSLYSTTPVLHTKFWAEKRLCPHFISTVVQHRRMKVLCKAGGVLRHGPHSKKPTMAWQSPVV